MSIPSPLECSTEAVGTHRSTLPGPTPSASCMSTRRGPASPRPYGVRAPTDPRCAAWARRYPEHGRRRTPALMKQLALEPAEDALGEEPREAFDVDAGRDE